MAVMGVASLALLTYASRANVEVVMENPWVRAFKGEESSAVIVVRTSARRWLGSQVISFSVGNAQVTGSESLGPDRVRLRFVGRYAGRSTAVRAKVALSDPLRLYLRLRQVDYSEFQLDILPDSLLAPARQRRLPIASLGELPAGSPGTGQELYALGVYHPSTDTKDIIWRRVARATDDALVARVRESNVKDVVRVVILQAAEREGEVWSAWMDLVCEGLASLGKEILQIGASLQIVYSLADGGLVTKEVRGLDDLAEALMVYSTTRRSPEGGGEEILGRSDFMVTGLLELEDPRIAAFVLNRPALLISERASPVSLGNRSTIFSGRENLLPFMRKIMER